MSQDEIIVRPYSEIDKPQVRKIAVDTAFLGEQGKIFFDNQELLADWLTQYYLEFEPESCFVARYHKQIAGYLSGCVDTYRYRRIFNQKILFGLILKSLCPDNLFKVKTQRLIYYSLRSFTRGEFSRRPDFSNAYPAHLHINIATQFRGKGIGTKLMEAFLNYLKIKSIKGVQVWTMTEAGKNLFKRLGFESLYNQRVTYFDNLLRNELYLTCFGHKLL